MSVSFVEPPTTERASPADLAFLAMDSGTVPEQFAVILILEQAGDFSLYHLRQLIKDRIRAIPRLRQRLINVPLGCGRAMWIDDPGFNIDHHVRAIPCQAPGDEPALLNTALSVIMTPLPKERPLWSAVFISGLPDDAGAVVVVLHHVLADGLGGLNVLAALVDPGSPPVAVPFPRPSPTRRSLARDAWQTRLQGLRRTGGFLRSLRRGMLAGGGLHPPRAMPCSLIQRTGPKREIAVLRLDRARLAAAAHHHGATTNDAVLVAVARALHEILLSRGEFVDPFVITVPVSGRSAASGSKVGNLVSPMLVNVPASGDVGERLAQVEVAVRVHKGAATGPPPIAVLGGVFRLLARLGGYRFYMNHQRRFHTLVTHVRGPVEPVSLGRHQVIGAIPVVVADGGNTTVYFDVLSYAGVLTIAVIVDPDHGPDAKEVIERLQSVLDLIMTSP
jgi:diacylglycerol O-acyltransferase